MNKTDQFIVAIVLLLILIHLAVGIAGYVTGRLLFWVTLLNLFSASAILIYWIQKQLTITQHIVEGREMLVIGLELTLVFCAIYLFFSGRTVLFARLLQYLFFGAHLLFLILGLFFMLSFKMNRLF